MILTVTVVTFMLVWHLLAGVTRGVLHPFTWVCLYYLFFFATGPTDEAMRPVVDLAVCLTFVVFSVAMLTCHRRLFRFSDRFMNCLWRGGSLLAPMKSGQVFFLALLPLVFSAAMLYVRIAQTGSFETALFGFYAVRSEAESLWIARFLSPLLAMGLGAVVFLRAEALIGGKIGIGVLALSLGLLLMLVLATRGARGGVVSVPLAILLADSCASVLKGRPTMRSRGIPHLPPWLESSYQQVRHSTGQAVRNDIQ